jgi:hypothetical protein
MLLFCCNKAVKPVPKFYMATIQVEGTPKLLPIEHVIVEWKCPECGSVFMQPMGNIDPQKAVMIQPSNPGKNRIEGTHGWTLDCSMTPEAVAQAMQDRKG